MMSKVSKRGKFNWSRVYRTLLPVLGHSDPANGETNKVFILEDTRTIALGGGRQTGKTGWIISEVLSDDDTIMICRDKPERDMAVAEFKKQYGAGGALKSRRKFFTANDLESMDQAKLAKILKKTKRVFIDDAQHNHKLTLIYNYLAMHMDIRTAIVVKVGT